MNELIFLHNLVISTAITPEVSVTDSAIMAQRSAELKAKENHVNQAKTGLSLISIATPIGSAAALVAILSILQSTLKFDLIKKNKNDVFRIRAILAKETKAIEEKIPRQYYESLPEDDSAQGKLRQYFSQLTDKAAKPLLASSELHHEQFLQIVSSFNDKEKKEALLYYQLLMLTKMQKALNSSPEMINRGLNGLARSMMLSQLTIIKVITAALLHTIIPHVAITLALGSLGNHLWGIKQEKDLVTQLASHSDNQIIRLLKLPSRIDTANLQDLLQHTVNDVIHACQQASLQLKRDIEACSDTLGAEKTNIEQHLREFEKLRPKLEISVYDEVMAYKEKMADTAVPIGNNLAAMQAFSRVLTQCQQFQNSLLLTQLNLMKAVIPNYSHKTTVSSQQLEKTFTQAIQLIKRESNKVSCAEAQALCEKIVSATELYDGPLNKQFKQNAAEFLIVVNRMVNKLQSAYKLSETQAQNTLSALEQDLNNFLSDLQTIASVDGLAQSPGPSTSYDELPLYNTLQENLTFNQYELVKMRDELRSSTESDSITDLALQNKLEQMTRKAETHILAIDLIQQLSPIAKSFRHSRNSQQQADVKVIHESINQLVNSEEPFLPETINRTVVALERLSSNNQQLSDMKTAFQNAIDKRQLLVAPSSLNAASKSRSSSRLV